MSIETKIIEALRSFSDGKGMTSEEYRNICASLGFSLRNNELGKTQVPVVYYILGMCNKIFGNNWGAARAFKKVAALSSSKEQKERAEIFVAKFVYQINKRIYWHTKESKRLCHRKIQITTK